MKQLIDRCITALTMVLALALIAAPAYAQGGGATSSIAGTVVDSGGGVIPGATVTATNNSTAGTSTVISQANGSFTIPALNVGTYTVNVSLQGFKTAVLKDVQVTSGGPANVRATLEVGGLSETVVVEGASAIVQTQTSAVGQHHHGPANRQPAAADAQHAGLRHVPAGRHDAGRQPRLHRERPAAKLAEHHARRRERAGQPPEDR